MTAALRRIASAFVLPAERPPAPPFLPPADAGPALLPDPAEVSPGAPEGHSDPTLALRRDTSVAVVCSRRDLAVVGGAAGLGLLETVGGRCAVVVEWTGDERPPAIPRPAGLAARRRAAALAGRGLTAVAGGRVVRVTLPVGEDEAVRAARDALAAAGAPAVLAIGGPRTATFDELVAEQTRTLLAAREDGDPDLAGIALAELAQLGPAVEQLVLPDAPVAAGFARGGVALVSPLRGAVLGCLERLR